MNLSRWPLHDYHRFAQEVVDSTNREAFRNIEAGVAPNSWFCADRQTAGRGTQGRSWHSEVGNLYASLYIRINSPPRRLPLLSLLAGIAACEAIERLGRTGKVLPGLCLKWPNDILLGGGKVCGILVESRAASGAERNVFDVVIGTGINIASCPPLEGRFAATSLAENGLVIPRDELFSALAVAMRDWLNLWQQDDGVERVREAWLARSCHVGRMIEIQSGSALHKGRFVAIDEYGALVLEDGNGNKNIIASGHLLGVDAPLQTGRINERED